MAGRVAHDSEIIRGRDEPLTEVAPDAAKYVVIAVCVRQAATGTPGGPGYQPAANVLLVSDVALRNSNLPIY